FDAAIRKSLPLVKKLYRNTYSFLTTIFTISESDKAAIEQITIRAKNKILIAGDTRCDQVIARKELLGQTDEILLPDNLFQKIASEKIKVFVAGSTWETDEQFILPVLQKAILSEEKMIAFIVPHEVN